MTDDLLRRATRALRETSAEEQLRSGLTRARILASAEKRYTPRRVTLLRWVVTVAAALAASTALARVAEYWPEIKRAFGSESAERSDAAVQRSKRVAKPAQPAAPKIAPAPAPLPAAPPVIVTEPELQPAAPAHAPATSRSRPAVARKRPAPTVADVPVQSAPVLEVPPVPTPAPAPESADLVLFRRAQRLHLAHDPRALAAWDDYLRVSSTGALAPDARYNRALCLIRLGRKLEALTALAPFAAGAYGNYRRSEARALIAALQASP